MTRSHLGWAAAFVLAVAAGCGGGPAHEVPPPAKACTGAVPAFAAPCPGAEAGLVEDAPWRVAAACSCTSPCTPQPCTFVCAPGYAPVGDRCFAEPFVPPDLKVTENGDGTVTVEDGYMSLVWVQDASCTEPSGGVSFERGPLTWLEALAWVDGLADGTCGLHDRSAAGEWQLPSHHDLGHLQRVLAETGAFRNVQVRTYWTSYELDGNAFAIEMPAGLLGDYDERSRFHAWAIRNP